MWAGQPPLTGAVCTITCTQSGALLTSSLHTGQQLACLRFFMANRRRRRRGSGELMRILQQEPAVQEMRSCERVDAPLPLLSCCVSVSKCRDWGRVQRGDLTQKSN